MKVKVIREMPFAKVGDVLEHDKNYISYYKEGKCHTFDGETIRELVEDGWLKEVKEDKKLIELFRDEEKTPGHRLCILSWFVKLSKDRAKKVILNTFAYDCAWRRKALNALDEM